MAGLDTNLGSNANVPSPYGSPRTSNEERGRSPHRFPLKVPTPSSPRRTMAKSSPLAKVAEETRPPIAVHTGDSTSTESNATETPASETDKKLVEVATPRASDDDSHKREKPSGETLESVGLIDDREQDDKKEPEVSGLGVQGIHEEMKTVEV